MRGLTAPWAQMTQSRNELAGTWVKGLLPGLTMLPADLKQPRLAFITVSVALNHPKPLVF